MSFIPDGTRTWRSLDCPSLPLPPSHPSQSAHVDADTDADADDDYPPIIIISAPEDVASPDSAVMAARYTTLPHTDIPYVARREMPFLFSLHGGTG